MTCYAGRYAELHDLLYESKPYMQEANFIHSLLKSHGRKDTKQLLELACGTGNHALALEQLGYNVLATDYSSDMLAAAKSKATAKSSHVEFAQQDMRDLTLGDKSFDAVLCLFDSIGFVRTNEYISSVLTNVHKALSANGLFVFEFWHAPAMLKHFDPVRIVRKFGKDGEILRISETTLDVANQLATVEYSIYELKNDKTYSLTRETQTNRFFSLPEMSSFLSAAHLKPIEWFDGYGKKKAITDDTWHILCVARKED